MKILWKQRDSHSLLLATGTDGNKGYFSLTPFDHLEDPLWKEFAYQRVYPAKIDQLSIEKKSYAFPKLLHSNTLPDYPQWESSIEKAKKCFSKDFQKVVLARRVELTFEKKLDPFAIFQSLYTNDSYAFYIEPKEGLAFFSFTPERLFAINEDKLISEALAATRKRGNTIEEDLLLEKELLSSAKDLEEFSIVKKFIKKRLLLFGSDILSNDIKVIKTPYVQHLYSKLSLKGASVNFIDEYTRALHPTPATLGFETEKARSFINHHEPFTRGLYAGAIGFVKDLKAEISVGIRSMVVRENQLYLFSGAGIVKDSNPKSEWNEINHKIPPSLRKYL